MAAVQITVSGTAQDVSNLIEIDTDFYVANAAVFVANTFQLNNKYDNLIIVDVVGTTTGTTTDPESWE